mmetsp:Transcript_600/g.764  ORF Transcript_600/g.764 Transcript_600/m.764 type:complete len:266 (-) Transcript_600:55-852(-)
MPTKFADIAKGPTDLLNDDYTSKVSLKCKKTAGITAVTIETTRGSGGALTSKIGTKFSYAGLSIDKVQLTADGGQVLETSLVPASGVKLSFKGNKGADLGIDYTSGNFIGSATLDVKEMSQLSASGCLGLPSGVNVGGSATYSMAGKTGLSAFNVATSYSSGPLFASVTTASKLSQVNVDLLYKVNDDLSLASSTTHSSSKTCDVLAIGGAYKAPIGVLKAKVGGDGLISACITKEVAPKVTVTASGSASASDLSNFKYGLGITI